MINFYGNGRPTPLSDLIGLYLLKGGGGGGSLVRKTVTSSSGLVNFTTNEKKQMEIVAAFSPVQASGTPSPENPLPISGYVGANIKSAGSNLYSGTPKPRSDNLSYFTFFSNFTSANAMSIGTPIPPHTTVYYKIVFSNMPSTNVAIYGAWTDTKTQITVSNLSAQATRTFTVKNDEDKLRYFGIWGYVQGSGRFTDTTATCQISLGDYSDYEPYSCEVIPITFPTNNLFDKSSAVSGYRINISGANYTDANYYVSAYIPVTVGTTYMKNSPVIDAYHRFATYSSNSDSSFIRAVSDSNTITIASGEAYIRFCGTIQELNETFLGTDIFYGGTLTINEDGTGKLVSTKANIASYNGETLNGEWISSMDVYAAGTTPTIGAQVVHNLATPATYNLTASEVESLIGTNNVWHDLNGSITVKYYEQT